MRYNIFIIFVLVVFSSCFRNNKAETGIIPSDKMGSVIFDMNVAEDFVNMYVAKDSSRNKVAELNKEYQKIYLLYNITEDQFKSSYEYYKSHPAEYKTLIDALNAKAQRRREDLYRIITN
ncbi:MAG: DUF4296 domain-containing protein [Agriterribacter sp.]